MVVIAETEDDLIKRFNEWKDNVENRGMRLNMNKTAHTHTHMHARHACMRACMRARVHGCVCVCGIF